MTATTITGLDLLRARMAGAIGGQMPGHVQRLGWGPEQLAAFQRDRLRALLARAIERSSFHAARLRGVDPGRFELADLPRLPVMTKAQMMEHFDAAVTDPRLTRNLVERHLARSAAGAVPAARRLCMPGLGRQLRAARDLSSRPSASTPTSFAPSCACPWPRP